MNHSSSANVPPSRLHIYPIIDPKKLLPILHHSRFTPSRRQTPLMGRLQRLHCDIARLPPLQPHESTPFMRKRRPARSRAPTLGTERQRANTEDPIEQRTVSNGGGAQNGNADLDDGPNGRVAIGPGRVEEGEVVELGDAVDGDNGGAVGMRSAMHLFEGRVTDKPPILKMPMSWYLVSLRMWSFQSCGRGAINRKRSVKTFRPPIDIKTNLI